MNNEYDFSGASKNPYTVKQSAKNNDHKEGTLVPVLSRFYGMVIKMYFMQAEHNPPHIHALYNGEYMGVMEIKTRRIMEGDLPPRAVKMLAEWVTLHEKELLEIWETQNFVKIPPLV